MSVGFRRIFRTDCDQQIEPDNTPIIQQGDFNRFVCEKLEGLADGD